MEKLEEFIDRLSKTIKCFYHKGKFERYSLKKFDNNLKGKMVVFAWVEERKRNNMFEISTYKKLGDLCDVTHLADKVVLGMHYVSKDKDGGEGTGIVFYVKKGSTEYDYNKAVRALKAIILVKGRIPGS